MSTSSLVLRIVSASVAISHRAGKIIRDVMSKGQLGIVEKGVNDVQTEADRSAQRCIIASLNKQFPGMCVFGEEQDLEGDVNPDWIETSQDDSVLTSSCPDNLKDVAQDDVVVWVDPLDGTSEYTQGLLDHVTVLIGVAVKGKAVGGVIYQPFYKFQKESVTNATGRCIWAVVGLDCGEKGAFGFERNSPPEGQNIITTTRSHSNKNVVDSIEACNPTQVVRVGGAGHKVLLLIEGKVNAYIFASPGCKKWDTCAPEAVLHAIGGKLTDVHGNDIEYHKEIQHVNSGGVLATLDADKHQWYQDRIPQHVRDNLPVITSV
ncbi:3'(2'),5'-bisphosphate nucleotidase 1-like [Tubulanus polymorphus]|uniref:3'(2'),5'-bisphosphate nucleotidase 1-like n=1 Tax=Tubulanus polymorphus TaxID=672921 RepID=UPI003DA317D0